MPPLLGNDGTREKLLKVHPGFDRAAREPVAGTEITWTDYQDSDRKEEGQGNLSTSSDVYLCLVPRFNQCYGVLGVLDFLHGTDTVFRQTKAFERHKVLLGFTPLSESIPDPPKKAE